MVHGNGNPAFVAVDWGTSSFRSWLMSRDGVVLAESRSSEGMLHSSKAGFEPVLHAHIEKLGAGAAELPVLICGMAGARQGWIEAPYLNVPTSLERLHEGAIRVPVDGDIRILPGIAQLDADHPDVMRGEETQILGVLDTKQTGIICIPGTHSKWIEVADGVVRTFTTYMTGELFNVLSTHSILQHAIDNSAKNGPQSEAFQQGLDKALQQLAGLTSSLFSLRASQLLGFSGAASGASFLSGLLIGAELADVLQRYGRGISVQLIGASELAKLYETALIYCGFKVTFADAEVASRQGLYKAAQNIWAMET